MDFLYFWVTSSKCWEGQYHENFFNASGGFLWGFLGALILGIVGALLFYFLCCNSKESGKYAKIGVWWIFMAVTAVVSYFYADLVLIGQSSTADTASVFYSHSFYKANDDYYVKKTGEASVSPTVIADLTKVKNEISSDLDKGGDVRFEFDLTTALLSALFFFLASLAVKRFTVTGKAIPMLKP